MTAKEILEKKIFSVKEITLIIKEIIEESFPYPLNVEGEIFDLSTPQSGHIYFSLKDNEATIRAVMFRSAAKNLKFTPENGLKVICFGRIGVYEKNGQYQLYVDDMRPSGRGDLLLLFENLKKKLSEEGLFDEKRKRKIPFIPRCIGVVTSPTGAAITDIIKTIHKRFPARILLCPSLVQGEEAPKDIISAIEALNKIEDVDVIIVGRGGGSIEDLWAFNDEGVVRAIYNSKKPVISAVGHEIDYCLSDFVADIRAATPTAAGEIVVPPLEDLFEKLLDLKEKLSLSLKRIVENKYQQSDEMMKRFQNVIEKKLIMKRNELEGRKGILKLLNPLEKIKREGEEITKMKKNFEKIILFLIREKKKNLQIHFEKLNTLSPLQILERGYSIAFKIPEKTIIKNSMEVNLKDEIELFLHKGKLGCEIIKKFEEKGK